MHFLSLKKKAKPGSIEMLNVRCVWGAAIRLSRQLLSAFKTCKLSVIVATWNLAVVNERSWCDLSPDSGIMKEMYVLIIIHSYINSSST